MFLVYKLAICRYICASRAVVLLINKLCISEENNIKLVSLKSSPKESFISKTISAITVIAYFVSD